MITYIFIGVVMAVVNISHMLNTGTVQFETGPYYIVGYVIGALFTPLLWPVSVVYHAINIIKHIT